MSGETDRTRDGRHINPDLGTLSGEGSQQRVHDDQAALAALQPHVYDRVPSHNDREDPTYYDHPVLKQPVWIWAIPLYFYIGGATGTAVAAGAAALAVNPRPLWRIVALSRLIGVVGSGISAALLIHDLGRPERFLYMLRVFRPSSPMSMGSWILSAFGAFTGLSVLCLLPGRWRGLGNAAHYAGGVTGLGLAGYTAVLLANTAVPIWQEPRRSLPFLFLGSGTASAVSLFDLQRLSEPEERFVQRLGLAAKTIEVAAIVAYESSASRVPQVGRPFRTGLGGALWQIAKVCTVASLAVSAMPGKSRKKRTVAGILGTVGGLCLRFGVYYLGRASSSDPRATFHVQRERLSKQPERLPSSNL